MSSSLIWNDDYCIGHEVIDSEHKRLFEIAGRILAINNPPMDTPVITKLVHELYDYMKKHFENEEAYMTSVVYSDTGKHKEKHAEIISEINDILRYSKDFIQLENHLASLMRKWLLDHILNEDLKVKKAIDIHAAENAEMVKK